MGLNTSPARFGHFAAEAVKHFRTLPGEAPSSRPDEAGQKYDSTVTSIGIWNEPNLPGKGGKPSTFLTVTDNGSTAQTGIIRPDGGRGAFVGKQKERDTASRYGAMCAAAWQAIRAVSPASAVKLVFGEMSSGADISAGEKSKNLHTHWPVQWLNDAVASAKSAGGAAWPGGRVRAEAFAIHPYGHGSAPWARYPKYPWSTWGLAHPTPKYGANGRAQVSVRKSLSELYAGSFRATAGGAPRIWATEFGYFNTKNGAYGKGTDSFHQSHSEIERYRWLHGSGGKPGELQGIAGAKGSSGPADVVNLFQVVENPPNSVVPNPPGAKTILVGDDYGFIGAGVAQPPYAASQELRLTGTRPYGKTAGAKPNGSLNNAPRRRVACDAVLPWSRGWNLDYENHGDAIPKC